jgi:hypothetical protein
LSIIYTFILFQYSLNIFYKFTIFYEPTFFPDDVALDDVAVFDVFILVILQDLLYVAG